MMKLALTVATVLLCAPRLAGDAASLRRAQQKSQTGAKRSRASMSAAAAVSALAALSTDESVGLAGLAAKYNCDTSAKHLVVSLSVTEAANRKRSSELNASCIAAQREFQSDLAARLRDADDLEWKAESRGDAVYASFEKMAIAAYAATEKEQQDLVDAANAAALASVMAKELAKNKYDAAIKAENLARALYAEKVAELDERVVSETYFLERLRDGTIDAAKQLHNESMALATQRHVAAKLLCMVAYEHRIDVVEKDEGVMANEIMPLVAQLRVCQEGTNISQASGSSNGLRFMEVKEKVEAVGNKKKRCKAAKNQLYGISLLQLDATVALSSTVMLSPTVMQKCNELNARIASEKVNAQKAKGHCIRENDGFFNAETRSFARSLSSSVNEAHDHFVTSIAHLKNMTAAEKVQSQAILDAAIGPAARTKGMFDAARDVDEEAQARARAAALFQEDRLVKARTDKANALARGRATSNEIELEARASAAVQRIDAHNHTDAESRQKAAECLAEQQALAKEADLVAAIRAKIRTLAVVTDKHLGEEVRAAVAGMDTGAVTTAVPVAVTMATATPVIVAMTTEAPAAATSASGFEVWRRNEHPRITTGTTLGCVELAASAEHSTCLAKCREDPTCKEVWAYDNGRCCMKAKSTPSGGWRHIAGGTYYKRK